MVTPPPLEPDVGLRSGRPALRTENARIGQMAKRLRRGRTVGRLVELMHTGLLSADTRGGDDTTAAACIPRQGLFAKRAGGDVMIVNTFP